MKYILDTSVAVKFYLQEHDTDKAKNILREAILGNIELVCPNLIYFEMNSSFAKKPIKSDLRDVYFAEFQTLVKSDIIKIVKPNKSLLKEAYKMSQLDTKGKGHISTFDATFHALALKEKCEFLTADKSHSDRTKDLIGSVAYLPDLNV